MRYIVNHRPPSWAGSQTIRDGYGHDVYKLDGRTLATGSELVFKEMTGRELAVIKRKVSEHHHDYELYLGGDLFAIVSQDSFSFKHCEFRPAPDTPAELLAEGNLLDHEYSFQRHGHHAAKVSKDWFSWANTYGVDVANGEDPVLILAAALVVDLCHHDVDVH
ncbi:MAG: LURP-one-related family protein [Armatimonadetes bacterium]|nr:LURP-one-related family protein [Armatimonadota bacterium]